MKTWYQAYRKAVCRLEKNGVPEAELDAWYLLEFVTGMTRTDFLLHREEELDGVQLEQEKEYARLIQKRAKRIPLSYITGFRNFCGLEFVVNETVLIPRQDTECLVEWLLPYTNHARILDLCTGSGCIAITLAAFGTPLSVIGTDLSEQALAVAKSNGERLLAGKNLSWIQSDLFEQVEGLFDIIVSNPPYIKSKVIETLEPEVRDYEPHTALDGSADGLLFYRRILAEVSNYLKPGGLLAFEIGFDQGEAVQKLMQEHGFTQVQVRKDLAGMDRIVAGWNGGSYV